MAGNHAALAGGVRPVRRGRVTCSATSEGEDGKDQSGSVGEALELLRKGLLPFFEREMRAVHGAQWEGMASTSYAADRAKGKSVTWDAQALLATMWTSGTRCSGRRLDRRANPGERAQGGPQPLGTPGDVLH